MQNEPPITQADRDLLADEYYADGRTSLLMSILEDAMDNVWYHHRLALRAIAKARQQGREQGLREAATLIQDNVLIHGCGEPYLRERPKSSVESAAYANAILTLIDKPGGAV